MILTVWPNVNLTRWATFCLYIFKWWKENPLPQPCRDQDVKTSLSTRVQVTKSSDGDICTLGIHNAYQCAKGYRFGLQWPMCNAHCSHSPMLIGAFPNYLHPGSLCRKFRYNSRILKIRTKIFLREDVKYILRVRRGRNDDQFYLDSHYGMTNELHQNGIELSCKLLSFIMDAN